MHEEDRGWMAYIDGEVRAVCQAQGWRHQIRRKWEVREKPVTGSPIADYEWKLIPSVGWNPPDASPDDFDGTYYVLSFDKPKGKFIFQHDTSHCGLMGSHWEVETYTEIRPVILVTPVTCNEQGEILGCPPVGWLRDHLFDLIACFKPNHFSIT